MLEYWFELQSYAVQVSTQAELSGLANAVRQGVTSSGGGSTLYSFVPLGTIIGAINSFRTGNISHLGYGILSDGGSVLVKKAIASGYGSTLGAVGCGVGMAAGVVAIGQDVYKAVQNARQSNGIVDFFNRQDVNGGWVYKGSQWVGNKMNQLLDNTLGKLF